MATGFETDVEAGVKAANTQRTAPVLYHALRQPKVQIYHKDSLNRYTNLTNKKDINQDHFLRPSDGKLDVLEVQVANDFRVYEGKTGRQRTWTARSYSGHSGIRDIPIGILKWTFREQVEGSDGDEGVIIFKYPIAAILLSLTAWLGNYNPEASFAARYPPVRYRNFCYAGDPRNKSETRPGDSGDSVIEKDGRKEVENNILVRHLRPRMLCVLTSFNDVTGDFAYEVRDTDEWDHVRPQDKSGEYIFVSYTREHFQTKSPEEVAKWKPKNGKEEFEKSKKPGLYTGDIRHLEAIGARAAHKAGLWAFWLDFRCIGSGKAAESLDPLDSHRICDVARGSNRVVIAVKELVENRIHRPTDAPTTMEALLQKWATRLWTLPEMLLAPTTHDLEVYFAYRDKRDGDEGICSWKTLPKRSMAGTAYPNDGEQVGGLVDHFEASVQLTQLELFTLGLECLRGREFTQYYQADMVYALMTMARLRPVPRKEKDLFKAFAQLSLLNDSNMLLERLICLLPPEKLGWEAMQDAWRVRLWDIVPTCQISDLAGDDAQQTVLIDGAHGASIEWRHLNKVQFLKRSTLWRQIGEFAAQFAILWLLTAIVIVSISSSFKTNVSQDTTSEDTTTDEPEYKNAQSQTAKALEPAYIVFFVLSGIAMAVVPYAMLSKYRGKFWSTQAVLYGMEGVPDIAWVERQIFGFSEGRLTWSPHGSMLSRHQVKEKKKARIVQMALDGECEALEPLLGDENQGKPVGWGGKSTLDDDGTRIFTVVDTYAMTVTAFRAKHPPTVALVLGHEGGMRRAALCSYNHLTNTFHRETIVRMPTKILDRMDRVDKFRFSLKSLSDVIDRVREEK